MGFLLESGWENNMNVGSVSNSAPVPISSPVSGPDSQNLALDLVRLSVQEKVDVQKADYIGTLLDTYA
jgi:hypothetical protein